MGHWPGPADPTAGKRTEWSPAAAGLHSSFVGERTRRSGWARVVPARWSRWVEPYVFLTPFLLTFLVFLVYPIFFAVYMSFTNWVGIIDPEFVGLGNYVRLSKDVVFWIAVRNNLWYTAAAILLVIPISVLIALLLNFKALPLKGLLRTIFFLPIATSAVVISIVFMLILDSEYGTVNWLLSNIGVQPVNWFADPRAIKPAAISIIVWRWSALFMIYFLAGLQSIPAEYYEAAKVDGANVVQSFLNITIPSLRPVILFVLVIVTHDSFRVFEEPFVLTSWTAYGTTGGPEDAALSLAMYLYRMAFTFGQLGYGSAVAMVIFAATMLIAFLQLKRLRVFQVD